MAAGNSKPDKWPEGLWAQLMSETEGLLPEGFAATVEHDLTAGDLGTSRRLALAYLEQSFGESLDRIMQDREHAIAAAQIASTVSAHLQSYETLVQWLKCANTRILVQIARRDDMDEVIAESHRRQVATRPH